MRVEKDPAIIKSGTCFFKKSFTIAPIETTQNMAGIVAKYLF